MAKALIQGSKETCDPSRQKSGKVILQRPLYTVMEIIWVLFAIYYKT